MFGHLVKMFSRATGTVQDSYSVMYAYAGDKCLKKNNRYLSPKYCTNIAIVCIGREV